MNLGFNNIKISFDKPEFKVDPYHKEVKCTLAWNFNTANMPYELYSALESWTRYSVGVAKVSKGDTFDTVKGKKIAQAKAEVKAYNKAKRLVERLLKEYEEFQKFMEAFIEKASDTIEHDEKFIAEQ